MNTINILAVKAGRDFTSMQTPNHLQKIKKQQFMNRKL